jgi:hypothetical protein
MKYNPKERCSKEEFKITSIENDTIFYHEQVSRVEKDHVEFRGGACLSVEDATDYVKPNDTIRLYGRGFGYTVRGVAVVKEQGRLEILRYKTPLEWATNECKMFEKHDREREEETEKNRKEIDVNQSPRFECKDLDGWRKWVKSNLDPYGRACVVYSEQWAELMEEKMSKGATLKDIAKDASHEADTDGITGFMYGAAVSMLSGCWKHGDELRRWHNLDTQIGNEGEKANEDGGTLNPALLGVDTEKYPTGQQGE